MFDQNSMRRWGDLQARTLKQRGPNGPGFGPAAPWTAKSPRPAQTDQIGAARVLGAETVFEFRQRTGIILFHEARHYI